LWLPLTHDRRRHLQRPCASSIRTLRGRLETLACSAAAGGRVAEALPAGRSAGGSRGRVAARCEKPLAADRCARSARRHASVCKRAIGCGGLHGDAAPHHRGLSKLSAIHGYGIAEVAPLEVGRRNCRHAIGETGVSVDVGNRDVTNQADGGEAERAAASVPGAEEFERRERNPADVTEAETDAKASAAEAEETY
jgi:hypothetical protein